MASVVAAAEDAEVAAPEEAGAGVVDEERAAVEEGRERIRKVRRRMQENPRITKRRK